MSICWRGVHCVVMPKSHDCAGSPVQCWLCCGGVRGAGSRGRPRGAGSIHKPHTGTSCSALNPVFSEHQLSCQAFQAGNLLPPPPCPSSLARLALPPTCAGACAPRTCACGCSQQHAQPAGCKAPGGRHMAPSMGWHEARGGGGTAMPARLMTSARSVCVCAAGPRTWPTDGRPGWREGMNPPFPRPGAHNKSASPAWGLHSVAGPGQCALRALRTAPCSDHVTMRRCAMLAAVCSWGSLHADIHAVGSGHGPDCSASHALGMARTTA